MVHNKSKNDFKSVTKPFEYDKDMERFEEVLGKSGAERFQEGQFLWQTSKARLRQYFRLFS